MAIFTADLQRFADKTKGNVDLVFRKVAFEMFRRVVMKSPVDTGRFKGNWQVAIGSIPGGVYKDFDKTPKGQVGASTIQRITAATLNVRVGQVIYLVNNLAYSRRLEYGYSKQAPAGMVRITAQEFGAVVRRAANEVPK